MITSVVSLPLTSAVKELNKNRVKYEIVSTKPTKNTFPLMVDSLYVIRHTQNPEGIHILIVAAKMGKEV